MADFLKKYASPTVGIICAACLTYAMLAHLAVAVRHPVDALTVQFQRRASASADDPKSARQVILDGIYARRTLAVALAYQEAVQQKPSRQARMANLAHAAAIANSYGVSEIIDKCYSHSPDLNEPKQLDQVIDAGRAAAISLLQRPDNMTLHTEIETEEAKEFKTTKIADAYLAWASFCGDQRAITASYQRALTLDPNFGEAYYAVTSNGLIPDGEVGYVQAKRRDRKYWGYVSHCLDKAERMEPRLHIMITEERSIVAAEEGNQKTAIFYLREYLRLWPNMGRFDFQRKSQVLARMEAAEKKREAT